MVIIALSVLAGVLALLLISGLAYRALRQRRVSQSLAMHTPNRIAESRFVTIGGIQQWIQIRGEDRANPILLIVHGHGLSMVAFTPLFRSWEQHFTVVQWDRRGAGKTMSRNGKAGSETWTLDLLAADGIEVTEYLCQHLRQDNVILVAHSQGSAVGLLMVKHRPISFTPISAPARSSICSATKPSPTDAIERARITSNIKTLKALEAIGAPAYPKVQTWLIKQRWGMSTAPEMTIWQPLALRTVLRAPNYSLRDVYHAFNDVLFFPQHLYDGYMTFDARLLGTRWEIPFFIFQGDSDVLTPTALAQEYFATVEAPTKALALLKDGGTW